MTHSQGRQPKGIPVGGQFATSQHHESDLTLPALGNAPESALRESRWNEALNQVRDFRVQQGRWPSTHAKDADERRLGRWVAKQRGDLGKGDLRPDREAALDSLGDWNPGRQALLDEAWRNDLTDVAEFYAERGRWPSAASRDRNERRFGLWLANQRTAKNDGSLTDVRAAELDALGDWNPGRDAQLDAAWQPRLRSLRDFYEANGRWPSHRSKDPDEKKIGQWLRSQREARREGTMREAWREALDEIGDWDPGRQALLDASWKPNLDRLAAFRAEHGRWPYPDAVNDDERFLGLWLQTQKNGQYLTDTRRQALDEAFGSEWNPPKRPTVRRRTPNGAAA